MLLHFLFDFALPWLNFRQAIRANDFEKMNAMYAIALPWFIVTNKHLYARICVDFVYILMAMNVTLLGIFNAHRTVSLLGHHGRNVAYDQANEMSLRIFEV